MKVLIVGGGLAGLATALALVTKASKAKRPQTTHTTGSNGGAGIQVIIIEKRSNWHSRGATFGLAKNGQISLQEIAPPSVLDSLKEAGIYMESSGSYVCAWWMVRNALLEAVQKLSPYRDTVQIHLGCVIHEIERIDDITVPLKVSFRSSSVSGEDASPPLPTIQEFDLVIGADGLHSQIRTNVLKLPPPVSVDLMVWRGVVEIGPDSKLDFVREWPIGKFVPFGERMQVTYFNLSTKVPNTIAWVFTCRNDTGHPIQCGVTTPWDMISIYRAQLSKEQQELDHDKFQTAKDLFRETHDPTDLTWSTELAVVDLEANGWGLQGRVVLVGDAAHAIRPASGLGGSLAFEDATCLSRMLFAHEREHDADPNKSNEYPSIPDRLQQFAALRLPRCQSISRDQTLRSEWSYKLGFIGVPAWDDAYRDWVMLGPDAPPDPPVDERDVFASLQGA